MHRVRLLRYHHIEPYIVFDGGPLPAKRGTEVERQRKRAECLARGKTLTAQGKKGEAREWFIKSVDVTTEMAFQ
jgi:exonuclease 1